MNMTEDELFKEWWDKYYGYDDDHKFTHYAKLAWDARANLKKKRQTKNNFDFFKARDGEPIEWYSPTSRSWKEANCIISPNACGFNGIVRITSCGSQWFDVDSKTPTDEIMNLIFLKLCENAAVFNMQQQVEKRYIKIFITG